MNSNGVGSSSSKESSAALSCAHGIHDHSCNSNYSSASNSSSNTCAVSLSGLGSGSNYAASSSVSTAADVAVATKLGTDTVVTCSSKDSGDHVFSANSAVAVTTVTPVSTSAAGASTGSRADDIGSAAAAIRSPRRLELLAPAKNLEVGQAAILAGADAVYIGGPTFGARAAAGNSMEDITALCAFAHRFGARVYLTVNTLVYDNELFEVEKLIGEARVAGVDALIVQDPALLSMPTLRDMEIHASTQMNVDTLEKVDFCRALHFSQIVLPREFDLEQITAFSKARPDVRYEVFISGAMCVSVSGICYISEYMTNRSANRGACAQICRLPMELYRNPSRRTAASVAVVANASTAKTKIAAEPQLIAEGHLLSMKDNLRLYELEDLVQAGASSFKIEGRLKDRDYVVNQVAAFRERLDKIIAAAPDKYRRASIGTCSREFVPDVNKTFNRGFTSSYLQGSNEGLVDIRTPKSLGEELGKVVAVKGTTIELKLNPASTASTILSNGDSFTFFNEAGELTGFRTNRIVDAATARSQAKGSFAAAAARAGAAAKSQSPVQANNNDNKSKVQSQSKSKWQQDAAKLQGKAARWAQGKNGIGKGSASASASTASSITATKGTVVQLLVQKPVVGLKSGMTLYRNVDTFFIKSISMPKAITRKVALKANINIDKDQQSKSLTISFSDEYGRSGSATAALPWSAAAADTANASNTTKEAQLSEVKDHHPSEPSEVATNTTNNTNANSNNSGDSTPRALAPEVMLGKITKLGEDYLTLNPDDVTITGDVAQAQLPLSAFNALRREALSDYVKNATSTRIVAVEQKRPYLDGSSDHDLYTPLTTEEEQQAALLFTERGIDPRLIANTKSRAFYQRFMALRDELTRTTAAAAAAAATAAGSSTVVTATAATVAADDKSSSTVDVPVPPAAIVRKAVMTCRNCLVKNHAVCHKDGGSTSGFFLRIGKHEFDIVTDCKKCLMYLVPREKKA